MKLMMLTLLSTLACCACSVAEPAPAVVAAMDQDFRLKVGGVARFADGELQIGFDGVMADSRCPKGEQCVWAGDARVRVWWRQGGGPKLQRELHTRPGPEQTAALPGYGLTLVNLEPAPVSGRTIASDAYVATLRLSHGQAAVPDR